MAIRGSKDKRKEKEFSDYPVECEWHNAHP